MNTLLPIDEACNDSISPMPVRHIAITGSRTKSCTRVKQLLKRTNYYCLVDCYRSSDEMLQKELFYLPDCVILEIRSLHSLFSIGKNIQKLSESFPGTKLVLYYNFLRRCPLLEQKYRQFPGVNVHDDEQEQVFSLERVLQGIA